jgi:RecA-family ATPase
VSDPEYYWGESLNKLINEVRPAREALIEGFLYKKSAQMIYAPDGAGKSLITLQAAIQGTVDGNRVFGELLVPKAFNTLYVQAERSVDENSERLKRMTSKTPFDLNHFVLTAGIQDVNLRDQKSFTSGLDRLKWIAEQSMKQVDLVVLDPIYALVRGGLKDDEGASFVTEFSRLLQFHFGCSVLLVHHANRGTRDKDTGGRVGEDMFGSRFLSAHCTGVYKLTLNHEKSGTTLENEKSSNLNLEKRIELTYEPETDLSWVQHKDGSITKIDRLYNYMRLCKKLNKAFTFEEMQSNSLLSTSYLRGHLADTRKTELEIVSKGSKGKVLYKYVGA